jgi:transposase
MSVPGVGTIAALTYAAAIDDPARFTSSKTVGAHFGLTPTRYQSGETDRIGRISKIGDASVRAMLYESAHIIITRSVKVCTALKSLAMRIAKRAGTKKAHGGARPQARRHHASNARRWNDVHDPASVAPCSAPSRCYGATARKHTSLQ